MKHGCRCLVRNHHPGTRDYRAGLIGHRALNAALAHGGLCECEPATQCQRKCDDCYFLQPTDKSGIPWGLEHKSGSVAALMLNSINAEQSTQLSQVLTTLSRIECRNAFQPGRSASDWIQILLKHSRHRLIQNRYRVNPCQEVSQYLEKRRNPRFQPADTLGQLS